MQKILVIGYVWPEPSSSAAGARMMQLLQFFLSEGFSVTFASTATDSAFREDIETLGINLKKIVLNDSGFDDFLHEYRPEIVVYDRFMMEEQFGWRVEKNLPNTLTILDTEDLHFLRKFRQEQIKNPSPSAIQESELAKREIASMYRCDLSLIISEAELVLLENEFQFPQDLLFYLPFLRKKITEEKISVLPKFSERKNFLFIGNFLHAPNLDAVYQLKENIWPLIRKKLPVAELHIYGAYLSQKIQQLHQPKDGFIIKGRAENAGKIVQSYRLSLAPLRFGAGLKGKLLESMEAGTPSITTSIGAEGINGSMPWNGEITNDPARFSEASVFLYNSEEKWIQARDKGFLIINERFPKNSFEKRLKERLVEIRNNLVAHRIQNFTGTMLKHHRVKSTYYLSRYIEVKNKLIQKEESREKNTDE